METMEWQDPKTGLPCLIVRHPLMGHLCGCVGVSKGHPSYEVDASWDNHHDLDVHGGITFAAKCHGRVCHVVPDGEDDVWWLGFDAAHSGDLSPAFGLPYEAYRNFEFMTRECERLAVQLVEKANNKQENPC